MKRTIRYILGISFLILGFAGLFLPVLQGILFLIIGLLILAPESKAIRKILAWLKRKYPAVFLHATRFKKNLQRRFGRSQKL
jgi:uncharacterized membrane protein YbaN (DUF454 family)